MKASDLIKTLSELPPDSTVFFVAEKWMAERMIGEGFEKYSLEIVSAKTEGPFVALYGDGI